MSNAIAANPYAPAETFARIVETRLTDNSKTHDVEIFETENGVTTNTITLRCSDEAGARAVLVALRDSESDVTILERRHAEH